MIGGTTIKFIAGDPNAPIVHLHGIIELDKLSDAELDALEAFTQTRLMTTPAKRLLL
jgi:hypothetical protein